MTDEKFDAYYPLKMRKLSGTHWTPVGVAKKAIEFLSNRPNAKILDLGSGAGKFCIVAGMNSKSQVTGVEQRENLVLISRKLALALNVKNVEFIHADILEVDFNKFDAFYFFNSFEEKINLQDRIDSETCIDPERYSQYCNFLKNSLDKLRIGARVVTYCGEGGIIPDSYTMVKGTHKGKLLFWEKRY